MKGSLSVVLFLSEVIRKETTAFCRLALGLNYLLLSVSLKYI